MTRPILLDLYCGAGGAAMGYHRAGFDVIGVDIADQPHYPFEFWRLDALDLLARGAFDNIAAIHASPPCQQFTAYRRRRDGVGDRHRNLIPQTRAALRRLNLPYVIENVPGAKNDLQGSLLLCGSMFGLDVQRHRIFESNHLMLSELTCAHWQQQPRFPAATNRTIRQTVEIGVWRIPLETQQAAMGIDWMPTAELSQAIPPAYTEYIGTQLLATLTTPTTTPADLEELTLW
jgi:DNA (cytosine-5)-methyltransferase 1